MVRLSIPVLFLATAWFFETSEAVYQPLFVIERSTNANVIHYDAKLGKDGNLDPKEPVVAYWIMAAEDGRRQALTHLELEYAYGFTIQKDDLNSAYRMILVSQKGRSILITQNGGSVFAETTIGGHASRLYKIYVKTRRSGLLRTADYFELFGDDIVTGAKRYERISSKH